MVVDATKRHNNSSKRAEKRLVHIPEALNVLDFNLISCHTGLNLSPQTRRLFAETIAFLSTIIGETVKSTSAHQNY